MSDFADAGRNGVLAQAIDELSAQYLIESDGAAARDRQLASLAQLSRNAAQAGRSDIATAAGALADKLTGSSAKKSWTQVMESGLQQLSSAVNSFAAAPPPGDYSIARDPELINDFVVESREHLESIEAQVLTFNQASANDEAIHSVFRSFHTIKGLAGFMELPLIHQVAHEIETILDQARLGERQITPGLIDVVLEGKDYLAQWIGYLEQATPGPVPDHLTCNVSLLKRIHDLAQSREEAAALPEPLAQRDHFDSGTLIARQNSSVRSIKVDTSKLDHLVDMVGEMVIAQSLVRHDPGLGALQTPSLSKNLAQLVRITDEVQRTAMSMRMVPLSALFQKMARLIRDLARKMGKQITFATAGEEVELDRNIVEQLADPLMHMVRNSIDHGVETPAERSASGKDPMARIEIRARHRSGYVVIEVIDDGKGIDRERVLAKARSKGLVAPDVTPPDSEVFDFIFHPGFSTAEQVTDVSGRGVGMDVVKKQLQLLRGTIDIASKPGLGTSFSLKLPLTLAIIDGLVVAVGAQRFIIPLPSIVELVRPLAGMVTSVQSRTEVVSIRERLLPLVRLHQRFRIAPRSTDPAEGVFVVVEYEGTTFCLLIDELIGKQEVVIKSLGPAFQSVTGVAGGAILGDGNVALILDIQGVFEEGSLVA